MQNKKRSAHFSKLEVGMSAQISRVFTQEDIKKFAHLSGDTNPLHIDQAFAQKSTFSDCLVHGALTSSLISTLAGCYLPGYGSIFLEQSFRYLAPVYIDYETIAKVTIINLRTKYRHVTLQAECFSQNQQTLTGNILVKAPL